MFRDREEAAKMLALAFQERAMRGPLVLAIPRGGVVTGAVVARELNADLDIVLSRKLRAPGNPEVAIGAVTEDGSVYLNPDARDFLEEAPDYFEAERRFQSNEIARRGRLFRCVRPQANVAGRTVIVVDDGIATGSTMIWENQLRTEGRGNSRWRCRGDNSATLAVKARKTLTWSAERPFSILV